MTSNAPPPNVMQKNLFSLTWPIFIDTLMVFLINAADAWFLSQQSDEAAAAVGAVLPIAAMSFSFFVALNAAGTAVAARQLGQHLAKGNYHAQAAATIFGTLLILCALAGLFISALLLFFSDFLAALIGLHNNAATTASTYLHTLGFGTLFLALRFGGSAILQAHGKTQWNMVCTVVMTVMNIFFNYGFIYGKFGLPALGVFGIALATCLAWGANLLATLIAIYCLSIKVVVPRSYKIIKRQTPPILAIAIPSVLEPLAWHVCQLFIMSIIISLGSIALATRVYVFNIIFIVIIFTSALSAGVLLKVSYLYGAQHYQAMHKMLVKSVWQGLLVVSAMVAVLYFFAAELLGLFSLNPAIIALGTSIFAIAIFAEAGRLINMVVGLSVKVTGHATFIASFGIATMWLMALPLTWLAGVHWGFGLVGIWLVIGLDECFRGIVALVYWHKKQQARLINSIIK